MIPRDTLLAYLDDDLPPATLAEVEAALAADPAALHDVLVQRRLDRALAAVLAPASRRARLRESILAATTGRSLESLAESVRAATAGAPPARRSPAWILIPLAAAALLVLALHLWRPAPATPSPRTAGGAPGGFGQFTRSEGSITRQPATGPAADATAGDSLQAGDTLRVAAQGRAELQLADGTRVTLDGGTELQLGTGAAPKDWLLRRGRLVAEVARQPAAQPLGIATPLARALVLGTAFALEADPRSTRIDVREGRVRMTHAAADSQVEVAAGEFALALPGLDFVAGPAPAPGQAPPAAHAGGPRDPAVWPFAVDSPWNRALGESARRVPLAAPAFDLAGPGIIVQVAAHLRPFWVAAPADRAGAITARYAPQEWARLPLPAAAFANGDWINGTVIDPARGLAYELTGARRAGADVEAMLCSPVDLRGSGVPPEQAGTTFSGLPLIAGVIRAHELRAGIPHVLAAAVLHTALNRTGPAGAPFVWPARHMPLEARLLAQMGAAGNLHYGTLLALPRDLDLDSLGLEPGSPAYHVARALQDYGAYVTHSFAPVPPLGDWRQPPLQLFADLPADRPTVEALAAQVTRLAPYLQVVENNGPDAVGGGGPARCPAAPALQ